MHFGHKLNIHQHYMQSRVNNLFERFVTRPDVKKEKLAEFQDWCLIRMEKANGLCTNDD